VGCNITALTREGDSIEIEIASDGLYTLTRAQFYKNEDKVVVQITLQFDDGTITQLGHEEFTDEVNSFSCNNLRIRRGINKLYVELADLEAEPLPGAPSGRTLSDLLLAALLSYYYIWVSLIIIIILIYALKRLRLKLKSKPRGK
jgi:hypothetical protein